MRSQSIDTACCAFLWRASIEGIDAVLTACGRPPARDARGPNDDQQQVDRALAIRDAMAEDAQMEAAMEKLADELEAIGQTLARTESAIAQLDGLDAPAKRTLLKAPQWKELDGAFAQLRKLHQRTSGFPVVNKWFPKPQAVDLPYDEVPEELAAPTSLKRPAGTDHLQLSSKGPRSSMKLGDTRPGTGRL